MAIVSAPDNIALPASLEFDQYRRHNPDLAELSDETLVDHYRQFGETEGRRANSIGSRNDFAALIPETADALEIGPFYNPLLRGKHTKYFDVMARPALVERAHALGAPTERIPEIDFVSSTGDLGVVDGTFEFILSSHSIEHQPDLIGHLRAVGKHLRTGGRYFILVPDKRYCFDHYIAESTLADAIDAHQKSGKTVHSLKSVIEHRVLTTHNDPTRHWANDHGTHLENYEARMQAALAEFSNANGTYIDVHAWYFTPASATTLLSALYRLDYTQLEIERLYPTRRGSNEFWIVLRR